MPKERKSPSSNQNWIKDETNYDYHQKAIKAAEKHQAFEAEHIFKTERVDSKTVKLKLVK